MDTGVTFLDCPAYLDRHGTARCGLPAMVEYRYPIRSTEGMLDGAKIRCPRGHWFNGPLESLTCLSPGAAAPAGRADVGEQAGRGPQRTAEEPAQERR
jgi:hypothetical protein